MCFWEQQTHLLEAILARSCGEEMARLTLGPAACRPSQESSDHQKAWPSACDVSSCTERDTKQNTVQTPGPHHVQGAIQPLPRQKGGDKDAAHHHGHLPTLHPVSLPPRQPQSQPTSQPVLCCRFHRVRRGPRSPKLHPGQLG